MLRLIINMLIFRDGSRTAATSKMELFVITVKGWKPLTIITKCSILDVAAVLDPPLILHYVNLIRDDTYMTSTSRGGG